MIDFLSFSLVLFLVLLVSRGAFILLKWTVSDLERRYEERQSKKYHDKMEEIVQSGSERWTAVHRERIANDPEYRARNEAYMNKLRAEGVLTK
jgi:biopolymer transport protein ExbB/TolQ